MNNRPRDLSRLWLFAPVEAAVVAGSSGRWKPWGWRFGALCAQRPGEPGGIRLGLSRCATDLQDVRDADSMFAIVNGTPPDEGVMVELGAAMALGKPTFLFRDDFRRCTDSEEYPLNLMLFAGLPEQGWQDFVYTDLSELGDPRKAMARWALS